MKKEYIKPEIEVKEKILNMSILSNLSVEGDIEDIEFGEVIDLE
ncbi:MAG: hypothetical protein SOZ18_06240 [Phocaeicola sp.]|nr:hypothetical protein [Phocaeicola sp.]